MSNVQKLQKHWHIVLFVLFLIANCFIWYAVWREQPRDYLTVAFLNIGQGDAIYVESPTREQIMIDGGPAHAVLAELTKVMPFYDRTIDTLLVTNPDADHFAGFIDILESYKVEKVFEPGTHSSSTTYKEFTRLVTEKNIPNKVLTRGSTLDLGGGAVLQILYPDRDVSGEKTNDGSIIAKLTYKNTCVILTGDAPIATMEKVVAFGDSIRCQVLKAGHHGSRTSASEIFTNAVNPQYTVISAGYKNRYNHPHKETVELMEKLHIPILGTYEKGTIIMKLDGTTVQTFFVK